MAEHASPPAEAEVADVRVPTPLDRLRRWVGPPRPYAVTRWLILRLLGVVYVFAFLGLRWQGLPLFGEHGLTPAGREVDQLRAAGRRSGTCRRCSCSARRTRRSRAGRSSASCCRSRWSPATPTCRRSRCCG